ncbi:putative MSF multidrug transporter [Lepidopterella palustris CBS 459.81]|uniref:Putative MSF multidrug transporter n=1 Tax=Lepidopterella palustris CBS 459.81 TaxID=1314670 RepID=A0A8E2EAE6_9PEZI|nr:putative MSF multidrug transporter [Lepidopterella palustris CBS 459.81]
MTEKEKEDIEAGRTPKPGAATPDISETRLNVVIAGLWLSLFISAMDTTIITTALLRISSDFNALNQSGWLVVTYLLTYNSFLMITAKLSDAWGIKPVLLVCNLFFLAFSMACGAAQTMNQLIIFRAFQGIGGSGLYSLVFVAIMRLISPEKIGFYSGVISSVFAIANLLGPVLGGVITDNTTWRWIFFLNGPVVGSAFVLLAFAMPGTEDKKSHMERLKKFDIIGGILSVGWPIPLLFALQEGGSQFAWNSSTIIGTLTGGALGLIVFGLYETWITYRTTKEPIFPIKFLKDPVIVLLMSGMFFLGFSFYAAIIELPQRFQAVNGTSAARAGILLLALTLATPVGAMIAGVVMGKVIAAEYLLVIASAITILGGGLLSSLPVHHSISSAEYGFEVIMGLGLGFASPPYYFLLGTSIDRRDLATATGALNMFRTLGGSVGVAICSALLHTQLRTDLPTFLDPAQVEALDHSIHSVASLPPELAVRVGTIFGHSYNKQFRVLIAFASANLVASVLLLIAKKRNGTFGLIPDRKEDNGSVEKANAVEGGQMEMPADDRIMQESVQQDARAVTSSQEVENGMKYEEES